MVNKIISQGKKLFSSPQTSVISAATIIMFMVVASRILGLVRQRTLAQFFTPEELSLFFAAFRLPDLIFEVLVFGTFSSAFIPVFTSALKKGEKDAWKTAATVTNIGLVIFVLMAIFVAFFAGKLYSVLAPGFSEEARGLIVGLTRLLFAAQGFFVVSYVLTAVLESSRRFLVPALAPLFYNIGIILSTLFFAKNLGLTAPALGVVFGASTHFLIQLPLAMRLGFRFRTKIEITDNVKKMAKLALPRVVEVSFLQISKSVELFLSSLISAASYAYFTFANTLQLLPVGLFGTSIAKAALPTLSSQSDDPNLFRKTVYESLYLIVFLVLPLSLTLMVLRIPLVRLIFGTDIFSWESTVQTGKVVSAFAIGITFQAVSSLLARAFYALQDTKTPVVISISAIFVTILFDFLLIRGFGFPVWALALAYSLGSFSQALLLFLSLNKKIENRIDFPTLVPLFKTLLASFSAGAVMFFLLKVFDRSVWIKRLSFLGKIESTKTIPFERFVLDTRYTTNLLILTFFVGTIGLFVYFGISLLLKSKEIVLLSGLVKRIFVTKKVEPIPAKEPETITPIPTDTAS